MFTPRPGKGGVCRTCKGKKVVEVRTKGGVSRRPCAACGGTGCAGPRTK